MKKNIWLISVGLCIFTAAAQEQLSIPFIIDSSNSIAVYATINEVPGFYQFDTGTFPIVVRHSLGNTAIAQPITEWIKGYSFSTDLHVLRGFGISRGRITDNVPAIEYPPIAPAPANEKLRGILGLSPFIRDKMEIRFSDNTINMVKSIPSEYTEYTDLYLIQGKILTSVILNGEKILCEIHTGEPGALRVPTRLIGTGAVQMESLSWEGNYSYAQVEVNIFGKDYGSLFVAETPYTDETKGVIGLAFLKRFDIVLDIPGGKLWYKQITPDFALSQSFSTYFPSSGVYEFSIQEDGVLIKEIIKDSPMWKEGMRAGTKIKMIAGHDASKLNPWEIFMYLNNSDEAGYTYE